VSDHSNDPIAPALENPDKRGFELRKRRRWPLVVAAIAVVAIVGAGIAVKVSSSSAAADEKQHFGTTLKVAYLSTDGAQEALLKYIAADVAPKHGIHVTPVGIGDPNQISEATNSGDVAGTIYAHKPWIEQTNASAGWKITPTEPVFQWAYSLYSSKYASIGAIPDGSTIAILDDPANTAQALMLLQNAGLITFKSGVDPAKSTLSDIATNPHKYVIKPIAFGSAARSLNDFGAIISYNFEFVAAGTPQQYKIYAPPASKIFAGQLAIATKYLLEPNITKLIAAFKDPAIAAYLKSTDNPHVKDQLTPVSAK
jgi:ABC-type metal ion transport system substrate-binding protein